MALFRKKTIIRPKSPLGLALLRYDDIIKKDMKGIIKAASSKKALNPKRGKAVFDGSSYKLDNIIEDISKENLKVDYRSDKIRYLLIDMINMLKTFFVKAIEYDFDSDRIEGSKYSASLAKVSSMREDIKKRMKDIESDYI